MLFPRLIHSLETRACRLRSLPPEVPPGPEHTALFRVITLLASQPAARPIRFIIALPKPLSGTRSTKICFTPSIWSISLKS